MQKPTEMAFITLVAYEKQRHHYWARFAKSVKGKPSLVSHKRFYFHDYEGGQKEALFWAKDWRDWEYEKLKSQGLVTAKSDWSSSVPPAIRHRGSTTSSGNVMYSGTTIRASEST